MAFIGVVVCVHCNVYLFSTSVTEAAEITVFCVTSKLTMCKVLNKTN